jgi:hypothetical protein
MRLKTALAGKKAQIAGVQLHLRFPSSMQYVEIASFHSLAYTDDTHNNQCWAMGINYIKSDRFPISTINFQQWTGKRARPETEILDVFGTKAVRGFPPCYS